MTEFDPARIDALADAIDRLPERDAGLDAAAASVLGWSERRVTRLGLNGRTPGSWLWFKPNEQWGDKGSRNPPRLTGPRHIVATVAKLRAIAMEARSGETERLDGEATTARAEGIAQDAATTPNTEERP